MKISTQDLREAFKTVDFVPTNPVMDSSQFVRLRQDGNKLTLSMTGSLWAGSSVTGQANGGKWTTYLDRRLFKVFLGTASEKEIEIFYKDKLTMKSGQRFEQALHTPITGYEQWEPKTTTDLTDDQIAMLKTAVKYLPNIAGTENVEAIYFSSDLILVTDTLMMMAIIGSVVKSDFFLPPDVAKFLAGYNSKIAIDKNGVGVALTGGFVYQPRSAKLDTYPVDKCKTWINEGVKSPLLAKFKASEFLDALRISSQFILDKSEVVTIDATTDNLMMTVDTQTGKFQRSVSTIGVCKLDKQIKLPAKKVIPYLEYANGLVTDCEMEYAKLSNASVFRFTENKRKNVLLVADM